MFFLGVSCVCSVCSCCCGLGCWCLLGGFFPMDLGK